MKWNAYANEKYRKDFILQYRELIDKFILYVNDEGKLLIYQEEDGTLKSARALLTKKQVGFIEEYLPTLILKVQLERMRELFGDKKINHEELCKKLKRIDDAMIKEDIEKFRREVGNLSEMFPSTK